MRVLVATTLGLTGAFVLALRIAVSGVVPQMVAGGVATGLLVALVAVTFHLLVILGPCATDERGAPRPLLRRHGFWVVAIGAALALPTLGAFGLVDPWETHYAEVAREMIERRDFISPWWANEGWFFSKPILIFWLEALSMVVLGAGTGPNAPIAGGAHPEWAVRFPAFAFALLGTYALYHGVSRSAGRRAGFIGAIVLWSAPGFALLSHQAMTDMPLVAGVAGALGFFVRAFTTSDETKTATPWPGRVLAGVLLAAVALELVLVVASRSGYGSPHACGLPGQPACTVLRYAHPRITPLLQASLWAPLAIGLALHVSEERRVARLFALGGWACVALATMAKGPAGLVIPLAGCLLAVAARRSPRELLRLAPIEGFAIVLALVVPWYVAAYVRHGRPFLDELVLRHMLGRTLDHLHDTNASEDVGIAYYVRQLGYATFPWTGILGVGALANVHRTDDRSPRALVRVLLLGSGLVAFALVSMMRTKFHHYVLVAVPPLAMIAGVFVDERLSESARGRARATSSALLLASAAAITVLLARDVALAPARFVHLFTYRYDRHWPSTATFHTVLIVAGLVAAALLAVALIRRFRARAVLGFAIASVALSALLLDRYLPPCAADGGQRGVIDAYYKDAGARAGPLVAYQLNWKGENFYTGNDVALFISSGPPMKTYLAHRADRTVYFVTERGRVSTLRGELGSVRSFAELTGPEVSSEFVLVRAEL
jgi:4-amino-4-deoxy-L-arabinose transferase-like glycosyltransferase